ncbi:hypothetical protein A2U01_0109193, partial [Trifolium medium]|nr:hypothetical protein [Trifolium medium]
EKQPDIGVVAPSNWSSLWWISALPKARHTVWRV